MLTPYMNSVPAVIAKASAIHNPIVYAITHPKYRYAAFSCVRSVATPQPLLNYKSNLTGDELHKHLTEGTVFV